MEWYIEISKKAEEDLEGIHQYIAFSLGGTGTAWKQTERIRDKIYKLNNMPERYPVVQEEPWKSRGVRRINVDNYSAFYIVDKESCTVDVLRVFYSRRDLLNTLLWNE